MRIHTRVLHAVLLSGLSSAALCAAQAYIIVGTGQSKCYDNRQEIACPQPGQAFYGQDAQGAGKPPAYSLSADGLTVYDRNTGLTWQRSPDTDGKLTWTQARAKPAKLNTARFGGFSDWRLPSIKELYSLILFSGVDPSGPGAAAGALTPFIDAKSFKFVYGDLSQGERIIDSQYASSTMFVGESVQGHGKLFGVNFADGRIKGYDLLMPGGMEKTFFVQCVRGNPGYGKNDFHDHGDGTVTDRATGLMWSKTDSGKGMNWETALAWVQAKNAEKYLGHNDWRLPHAKELESLVDYSRSPDTTGSPAIDPRFSCTPITNEIGQPDYPYFWSGTTHASAMSGGYAVYVAFGRAAGWPTGMPGPDFDPPGFGPADYHFTDVHGAGAQRSDPKIGDPARFPHGHGPQGDVIRIYNFVRLVRNTAP